MSYEGNMQNILMSFENSSGCGCGEQQSSYNGDISRSEIMKLLSRKADTAKVTELFNELLSLVGQGGEGSGEKVRVNFKANFPLVVNHTRNSLNVIASFHIGNDVLLVNYKPSTTDTIIIYPQNDYSNVDVIIY